MVIIRSLVIGIVLFGASRAQQFPAPAQLLRDINATPTSSPPPLPHQFMTIGVWTYFVAADATHGTELFRTFGTTGSTALVADIRPGPDGIVVLTAVGIGSRLLFFADLALARRCDDLRAGRRARLRRLPRAVAVAAGGRHVWRAVSAGSSPARGRSAR